MTNKEDSSILIVDDSTELCLFVEIILTARGHTCQSVNSISSAKVAVECYKPAIILLDINLPDGLSFDLVEDFHEKSPNSKIIFMTGWEKEGVSLPEYVVGWLYKPFTADELLDLILQN